MLVRHRIKTGDVPLQPTTSIAHVWRTYSSLGAQFGPGVDSYSSTLDLLQNSAAVMNADIVFNMPHTVGHGW